MREAQSTSVPGSVPPVRPPFPDWLDSLNAEAKRRGYLGEPLSWQTGEDCWRHAYDDGLTPAEALNEDESYGE